MPLWIWKNGSIVKHPGFTMLLLGTTDIQTLTLQCLTSILKAYEEERSKVKS